MYDMLWLINRNLLLMPVHLSHMFLKTFCYICEELLLFCIVNITITFKLRHKAKNIKNLIISANQKIMY